MRSDLFRAKAQDRLTSPEQLDQVMRVTSARSWLAFIALAAVIIAAVIWGFVGQVPRTVSGQSILVQPGGIANVVALSPGLVIDVAVKPGDTVEAGQVVARMQPLGVEASQASATSGTPQAAGLDITSPRAGRVIELLAVPGNVLDIGDPVLSLEGDDDSIVAYVYVSDGEGKQIDPGMQARVSPDTVEESQYGHLLGQVQSVSEYPVTKQGLMALLNNEQIVDEILSDGAVLQVTVVLESDASTPSGFKWSSPKGPPYTISHGTLGSGSVVLDEQRPVSFVLPDL